MTNLRQNTLMFLAAFFTLATILVSVVVNGQVYEPLRYLAPICGLSSLVLFVWPMFTLRKYGQGQDGAGYMGTTTVVDRGLFAIVRHPQYLGYMGLNVTFMLASQQWQTLLAGGLAMALFYLHALQEERNLAARFGRGYLTYRQQVPAFNIMQGIIRAVRRRWQHEGFGGRRK